MSQCIIVLYHGPTTTTYHALLVTASILVTTGSHFQYRQMCCVDNLDRRLFQSKVLDKSHWKVISIMYPPLIIGNEHDIDWISRESLFFNSIL